MDKDRKSDCKTTFKKSISGKDIIFEIYDSVRGFTKDDWKRVVAVFVSGSEWEFRDWPKGENTLSIFLKIKGFFIKYSDLPTPPNVLKWNVKILEIHRNKRHNDFQIQNDLWTVLEDFLIQPRYREKILNQ